jgi:hypothetical protein
MRESEQTENDPLDSLAGHGHRRLGHVTVIGAIYVLRQGAGGYALKSRRRRWISYSWTMAVA